MPPFCSEGADGRKAKVSARSQSALQSSQCCNRPITKMPQGDDDVSCPSLPHMSRGWNRTLCLEYDATRGHMTSLKDTSDFQGRATWPMSFLRRILKPDRVENGLLWKDQGILMTAWSRTEEDEVKYAL
jgi:hypothetical protein